MSSQQILKNYQYFYQQQSQRATPSFGRVNPADNRTKITFLNKKTDKKADNKLKWLEEPKQRYSNLIQFEIENTQRIDPWNTSIYDRQDDVKGIWKLIQSEKKRKRKISLNSRFVNRAAVTTKSWNAERQRLSKLRKQMHVAKPVLQATTNNSTEQADVICFLKRKNQQLTQQKQQNSEKATQNNLTKNQKQKISCSLDNFQKHRKLLSRIYSYNCEPKIMIKHLNSSNHHNKMSPKNASFENEKQGSNIFNNCEFLTSPRSRHFNREERQLKSTVRGMNLRLKQSRSKDEAKTNNRLQEKILAQVQGHNFRNWSSPNTNSRKNDYKTQCSKSVQKQWNNVACRQDKKQETLRQKKRRLLEIL